MTYYLFMLKFLTPFHFGASADGGKLENISLSFSADTLFCAIVNEAAHIGYDVDRFIQQVSDGSIAFSSLFPYVKKEKDKFELYLPKPFVQGAGKKIDADNQKEVEKERNEAKKLKKANYVRVSEMNNFIHCVRTGTKFEGTMPEFAVSDNMARVGMRGEKSEPYYVGCHKLHDNVGMYFVLGLENVGELQSIISVVESLGLTGIGGKRSSGYGKFELVNKPVTLRGTGNEDGLKLEAMLKDDIAVTQIAIAPIKPSEGQTETIKEGFYKLIGCSGFVDVAFGNVMKRDSFYMLSEGSCFKKRIKGEMAHTIIYCMNWDIYRNGKGMFVGVRTDE